MVMNAALSVCWRLTFTIRDADAELPGQLNGDRTSTRNRSRPVMIDAGTTKFNVVLMLPRSAS